MFGNTWGGAANNAQQQPQQNAFGAPAQPQPGFGGTGFTFGAQQPQQQQQPQQPASLFGGTNTFGAPNPAGNAFGTPKPTFGFGTTAPAATAPATGFAFGNAGGAFGATTNNATAGPSLFGQPAAGPSAGGFAWGKPATAGFGAAAAPSTGSASPTYVATQERDGPGTATSHYQSITCMPAYKNYSFEELRVQDYQQGRKTAGGFGQTAAFGTTTTNAFGAPAAPAAPNAFGGNTFGQQTTTTNAFGVPATTNAFSFGAQQQQPQQQQQQPAPGAGMFGQPAQPAAGTSTGFGSFGTTGVFGQQQQQQQQPQTNAFGFGAANNTQPKPFGSNMFGNTNQPATTTANAFGFGQTQPAAPTTSIFGQPAQQNPPTSIFGAANNQPKPGLFGQPAAAAPAANIFGQPANNNNNAAPKPFAWGAGTFGQPTSAAPAPTGAFGQTAATQPANTGFGFGFGQQNQQQNPAPGATSTFGNLFGAKPAAPQAPTTNIFGQPSTAFGQTATQPNMFGQPPTTTTNLFGQPQQQSNPLLGGGSMFGQPQQNQQQMGTTNLFGQPAAGNTGATGFNLFAPKTTTQPTNLFANSALGSANLFNTNAGGQTQTQTLTAAVDQPIGSNLPVFQILPPGPHSILLNPPKKKTNYFASVQTRTPVPRLGTDSSALGTTKLRGFGGPTSLSQSTMKDQRTGSPFLNSSTSGPNLKGSTSSFKGLSSSTGLSDSRSILSPDTFGTGGSSSPGFSGRQSVKKLVLDRRIEPEELAMLGGGSTSTSRVSPAKVTFNPLLEFAAREKEKEKSQAALLPPTPSKSVTLADRPSNMFSTPTKSPAKPTTLAPRPSVSADTPEEGEYWTKPTVDDLKKMGHEHLATLTDFTVGRVGYGFVTFLVPVDLTSLPTVSSIPGTVVIFSDRECTVYPDEADKPPQGEGLNVRSRITLEKCWATDRATREFVKDKSSNKYLSHERKLKNMKDTEFVSFNGDTGVWVFIVEHFSRYGLGDDSDSEEEGAQPKTPPEEPMDDDSVEPEPESSPPPAASFRPETTSKLVRGADGEYYHPHELDQHRQADDELSDDDDQDPYDVASITSEAPRHPLVKPALPWSAKAGIEPHKVHVMQTSFFRAPEEALRSKAQKTVFPPSATSKQSSGVTVQTIPAGSAWSGFGKRGVPDEDVAMAGIKERPSFGHALHPIPYRPSPKYVKVSPADALATGKESSIVDSGLSLGRSFRVSWGPGGLLAFGGAICGPFDITETSANRNVIKVERVRILADDEELERERARALLELQCKNTEILLDDQGVPFAQPNSALRFSTFTSLFPPDDQTFEASLWRLGVAIFDEVDLRCRIKLGSDIDRQLHTIRRRAALSKWLQSCASPSVEAVLRASPSATATHKIFTMLTGNQVERACDLALESGNIHLATVIAQAGGDQDFRNDIASQLLVWREQKADAHIDQHYGMVMALLSGVVDRLKGSNAPDPAERCGDIDIAQGLDWKRIFGLHVWFTTYMDESIHEALTGYEDHFRQGASDPRPWYRESPLASSINWKLPTEEHDVLFNLIRMSLHPTQNLESTLHPRAFGPSPFDHRLPWHIYILLSRVMKIRDFARVQLDLDLEDNDYEGHSRAADLVAANYAAQLEHLGMIDYAVFVLLHLEDPQCRQSAIKNLLLRSAPVLDQGQLTNLRSLQIPEEWIDGAHASLLRYSRKSFAAYECFLKADEQRIAHDMAITELAPDAVIRQDLTLLRSLFKVISPELIDDWSVRGKLFIQYADIMERLPKLIRSLVSSAVPDAIEAAELETFAKDIPIVIRLLPDVLRDSRDTRQRACLAEMLSGLLLRAASLHTLRVGDNQLTTARLPVDDKTIDEASRLKVIQSTAFDRFLRSVETA